MIYINVCNVIRLRFAKEIAGKSQITFANNIREKREKKELK